MPTKFKTRLSSCIETIGEAGSRAILAAIGLSLCAPGYAQDGKEVEALWKPQEFTFHYQSFTSFYSCESLESKIEQILKQVGAKALVRVRSPDCGRGPVRMPRAEIQLISPVPATPDAVANLKQSQTQRELVARVTGKTAEFKEFEKPFAAEWKRVTIGKGRRAPTIERGDCELLDQIRRRLLPQLAVRVVEENTPCAPNSPSMMRPTLVVEALTAMPKPDEPTAAGGEEDSRPSKGTVKANEEPKAQQP